MAFALEEAKKDVKIEIIPSIDIYTKLYCSVPLTYQYYNNRLILVFHSITKISKDFGHTIEDLSDLICQKQFRDNNNIKQGDIEKDLEDQKKKVEYQKNRNKSEENDDVNKWIVDLSELGRAELDNMNNDHPGWNDGD